jgi:hypothetical protein
MNEVPSLESAEILEWKQKDARFENEFKRASAAISLRNMFAKRPRPSLTEYRQHIRAGIRLGILPSLGGMLELNELVSLDFGEEEDWHRPECRTALSAAKLQIDFCGGRIPLPVVTHEKASVS